MESLLAKYRVDAGSVRLFPNVKGLAGFLGEFCLSVEKHLLLA